MHKLKNISIETLKHWREISTIFLVQLVLGLVVSIVFYSEMSKHIDMSMVLDHLEQGFDRTVLMDLINSNDSFLGRTKAVGVSVMVLYLFVGVFLQGGWLANIRKKQFKISSLLSNGLKFIGPFLGMAIISIFMVVFVGGLVGFLFMTAVGDPLVTFSSEKPYVIWIACLFGLFIIWVIYVWSWSVISRCYYIDGNSFFKSLKFGFKTLRKKWLKFQAIGLVIVIIHLLFMFLYYWIMGDRGASSWSIVLSGIFVQQVFNYLRVVLRGFGYSLVEDLVWK